MWMWMASCLSSQGRAGGRIDDDADNLGCREPEGAIDVRPSPLLPTV